MWVNVVRLKVLSIDETAGCRSHVSIAISMESRLTEVSSHGAIREETPLKFQFLHLLTNAFLLFFGELTVFIITIHSLVSKISASSSSHARIPQATIHVGIMARLACGLCAFFSISGSRGRNCLRSEAHFTQFSLDKLPLQLHWMYERAIFSTLVNTSLELNGNVENVRALTKDPQLVTLLSEVWVKILPLLGDGSFLARSRPSLNLIKLVSERLGRTKELLIHRLVANLSFRCLSLLKQLLLEELNLVRVKVVEQQLAICSLKVIIFVLTIIVI